MAGDDEDQKKSGTWWLKTSGAIAVFIVVGLGTTTIWFFSTLYPIISQPITTQLGREPELAGPRLNENQVDEILNTYSLNDKFNLTSAKTEGIDLTTGVPIYDLGDLAESLAPLVADFPYDEVAALALDLNRASVNNGACELITTNEANFGNFGGKDDGSAKFKCSEMTATTKQNILELFELRKDHCKADNLENSTLFEHCLAANALTFSFYVVGGSATYKDHLDCEWTNLEMRDWSTIGDDYSDQEIASFSRSFGSRGSTFRASMEQYDLKCTSGKSKPRISLENGFITTEEFIVQQSWDRSDYYQVKLDCDSAGGNLRSIEAWEGDVMIGTLQMISFCKDSKGLDNAKSCFDHFFNSLPPDSVAVEGFSVPDNYEYAIKFLEAAWEKGISPTEWTEFFEGFQLQCPKGYYPPNSFPPKGVCWNAWRYVFGWGYDTKSVIGTTRWDVVGPALYRSSTLPEGTLYSSKQICSDENGDVIFEHITLGNYRVAGTVYEVTNIFRLANVLSLFVICGITVFATRLGDNRKHFFVLGLLTLGSLGGLWIFETAVNIQHSDMCEMRVSGLFSVNSGISSTGIWFAQAFDRITTASVAVALTQAFFWMLNPFLYNTGEMPSFVAGCIVIPGFLYATFVGFYGLLSENACAAWYGVHYVDIFLPFLISVVLLPLTLYGLIRSPTDLMLAKFGLEKPMDEDTKALYKKPRKLVLTDPRFGLKLYGHKIKKGTVMLTVNGIEVEEEIQSLVKKEGTQFLYTSQRTLRDDMSSKEIIPEEASMEIPFESKNDHIEDGLKKEREIAKMPSSSSLRYRLKKNESYSIRRSVERMNSVMTANDEKLEGTLIGDKFMEKDEVEDDAWFVYLIKLIFEKDGIA